jgi:heat-inducible transcriptional repressor
MDNRNQKILKAIITSYIETGDPIGSRTISKKYDFGLSPATIRNIMSDLEDRGLLTHPYTSSGRVPTEKGYRYYIDNILSENELAYIDEEEFERRYKNKKMDIIELMHETSMILSMFSHYSGVATIPRFTNTIFKYLKFIKLLKNHIMAIFVSEEGIVQNKVFGIDEDYSQKELDRITDYVNKEFRGLAIAEIRGRLLDGMKADKVSYNFLLLKVLRESESTFSENGSIFLEGATNVLNLPEFSSDVDKIKSLVMAFEEKYTILRFLNQCLDSEGVKVYIGAEDSILNNCSVVAANYKDGKRVLGTIGVIGPTRMEYARVIPLVDLTARILS